MYTGLKIENVLDVFTRPASWGWIIERYLPNGVFCPRCKAKISGQRALETFQKMGRVYCRCCKSIFSAKAITPLAATEWQPEQFVGLIVLHGAGKSPGEIGRALDKSCDAVTDMLDRIEMVEAFKEQSQGLLQPGTFLGER